MKKRQDFDKIVEKISNLLDLSRNNPNENEAIAAALKAQELMVKYDIQLADIETDEHTMSQDVVAIKKNSGYCIAWRYSLASLVANNFRCKTYVISSSGDIAFYGYAQDVAVACQVFKYLFDTGNKLSLRYYTQRQKEGKPTKGVMNSFVVGFMKGLDNVLSKQSTDLMVVVPPEVEDNFKEFTHDFVRSKKTVSYRMDKAAYETGEYEGKSAATSRELAGA